MPNRFYNESFSVPIGAQARSASVDGQFVSLESACDAIQAELDALRLAGSFLGGSDTPASFAGAALKYLRVNSAASAIEFVSGGKVEIVVFGGTSYTLLGNEGGALLLSTNGSPVTVTVPPEADIPFEQGSLVYLSQHGGGQVTFAPGAGVTINSTDDLLSTRKQHAHVALVYLGGDVWDLLGERNAPTLGFASLVGGNDFSGAQTVQFATLTDATNIATDAAVSNHFLVTLGGDRTLDTPTNMRDGGIYNFWIKQDGTGSRTLAYSAAFKWPGGTAPTLTTTAGALDLVIAQYNATLGILACAITQDVR